MSHASLWMPRPIMGEFSGARGPIFPRPDLSPKKVLPSPLPRNFDVRRSAIALRAPRASGEEEEDEEWRDGEGEEKGEEEEEEEEAGVVAVAVHPRT
eukprot:7225549-Pyramimonas_sp.AAC.1